MISNNAFVLSPYGHAKLSQSNRLKISPEDTFLPPQLAKMFPANKRFTHVLKCHDKSDNLFTSKIKDNLRLYHNFFQLKEFSDIT